MTKISIVVPIFHAHAKIIEALESIRLQTYPLDKLETIIVCDGSNDLCVGMAREFLQQHGMQGTVLAMDGNYGASIMLNRGWQAASGDWIQFLDSDDILAPNKLEMQISQTSQRCDVICSSWQRLRLSAGTWQPVGGVKTPRFTEPMVLKIVSLQSSVVGPALFRRKSLELVAGFSDMVGQLTSGHLMLKLWSNGGRFVEVPSPSPLYFVRSSIGADLARHHLQNVVVAEAMLRQQKSGALSRQDTKEIGRLCDESLSVLYDSDWAAFQQYWQWLREVDPKYAPRHSTKLKLVTLLLGYENAAALAFSHRWIWSSSRKGMSSVFGALRRRLESLRSAIIVLLQPNLSMGRSRFAGVTLFALIAGFASLAAMLTLGQFGGDANSSMHSRPSNVQHQNVSPVPSQRSSRISATIERPSEDAPMATSPDASLVVPKSQRADTTTSIAETTLPTKEAASAGLRETITVAIPTTAATHPISSAAPTESQQLAPPMVERTSADATAASADTESKAARTAAPDEPQSGVRRIAAEVPLSVPPVNADRPNLASLPGRALIESGSIEAPQSATATASLSPDTATPPAKPDGKGLETAPSGIVEPSTVALIARETPTSGTSLNPTEMPTKKVARASEQGVEPSTSAPPLTLQEREKAEKMLERGERELADGNVAIARQFFLRTATVGHARGAMLLATTYDPRELARLGVFGVQPNSAMARKWYERARELGAAEAAERLARLAAD